MTTIHLLQLQNSKKKKYIYIYIQSSTKCSEINLMKRGDREQLKAIVVLFNKVRRLWLFFFFFYFTAGDLAVEVEEPWRR